MQLNGELRQVIESLRLFKEFLPLKHGTSEELRELIHDKHLTALLQVKQKTIQTSLKGLSDCFEALSTAVKKGKLDKVNGSVWFFSTPCFFYPLLILGWDSAVTQHSRQRKLITKSISLVPFFEFIDAMRIADENLSNLTSVMIGVQYHLLKEYNNVKANKRRQGWNLLFTIVVGYVHFTWARKTELVGLTAKTNANSLELNRSRWLTCGFLFICDPEPEWVGSSSRFPATIVKTTTRVPRFLRKPHRAQPYHPPFLTAKHLQPLRLRPHSSNSCPISRSQTAWRCRRNPAQGHFLIWTAFPIRHHSTDGLTW